MIAGDVVLLNFPFSDLSSAKVRPALVLAIVDRDDFIAVQITSKRRSDRNAIELSDKSFSEGGLHVTSFARAGKLMTVHRKVVIKRVGRLRDDVRNVICDAAIRVIRGA
jgi:mRNA interferase MazF